MNATQTEQPSQNERGLRQATAMLPNLLTVANMFLGFYAIMMALDKRWIAASSSVFVAHICDILDGRVARWIGRTSRFGMEYDSFADWISFGIAPAFMVYLLSLKEFGKAGILLTFFYVLCGALRLARFNVKGLDGDDAASLHFTGLPIPGAGGFIAILVLLFGLYAEDHQGRTMTFLYQRIPYLRAGIPVIMFSLSLLMISKLQYSTFKRTKLFRPQSLRTFLVTLFVIFMIYLYPQNTIFILYSSYILWGFIQTGWRAYRLRNRNE